MLHIPNLCTYTNRCLEKICLKVVNTSCVLFDFSQNKCGRIKRQVLEERGKFTYYSVGLYRLCVLLCNIHSDNLDPRDYIVEKLSRKLAENDKRGTAKSHIFTTRGDAHLSDGIDF